MTPNDKGGLIAQLVEIVGRRHVLTAARDSRQFAQGYRYGNRPVLAIVRPATPLEQFHAFRLCVAAGVIMIAQPRIPV